MSDDHARLGEGLGQALRRPWKLTDAARLGVDAFAERYAASRGLSYQAAGTTPQDAWFLTTVYPKRSHSFMRGPLAGGPDGLLWYAEKVLRGGRGASRQPWTVAYYQIAEASGPARDIACAPRQNPLWGGRVKLASQLPRDLTSVTVGDEPFDQMYEIGITGESDQAGVRALFTPDFTAWMRELPYGKLGVESTRFEVHRGALCVFTRNALATTEDLDAFCQRAARIAAEVQRVARPGPPEPPA